MENIEQLPAGLETLFLQSKQNKRDADFYLRILIQAVLTHGNGGILQIDPLLSETAKSLATTGRIEFGNGEVRITDVN